MNNKERIIWFTCLIFLAFYINTIVKNLNEYKILRDNYNFSFKLQQDEISQMVRSETNNLKLEYDRGFRDGKRHAIILTMNKDSLLSYSDGYHAAIDQFDYNNTK
jgi:hypothetical protein